PNTLPGRMKNGVRNIRNVTDPVKTHVKLTSISGPDASRAALLLGCHFRHIGILKPSGYSPFILPSLQGDLGSRDERRHTARTLFGKGQPKYKLASSIESFAAGRRR